MLKLSKSKYKIWNIFCLNCQNYDLCIECFVAEIHKDKNNFFIFKKHCEDKWAGCNYLNKFDVFDEDENDDYNKNKINDLNKNDLN